MQEGVCVRETEAEEQARKRKDGGGGAESMRHRDRREERETGVRGRGSGRETQAPSESGLRESPSSELPFPQLLPEVEGWGSAKKAAPGAGANHPALPPEEE